MLLPLTSAEVFELSMRSEDFLLKVAEGLMPCMLGRLQPFILFQTSRFN